MLVSRGTVDSSSTFLNEVMTVKNGIPSSKTSLPPGDSEVPRCLHPETTFTKLNIKSFSKNDVCWVKLTDR